MWNRNGWIPISEMLFQPGAGLMIPLVWSWSQALLFHLLETWPDSCLWPTLRHPLPGNSAPLHEQKHPCGNILPGRGPVLTLNTSSSPGLVPYFQLQRLSPGSSPSSCPLPQSTLDQCAQSRWRAKKTVSPPAMTRFNHPSLFLILCVLSLFLSSHSLLPSVPGFGASNIDLSLFLEQLWGYVRACTIFVCVFLHTRRWPMLGAGAL